VNSEDLCRELWRDHLEGDVHDWFDMKFASGCRVLCNVPGVFVSAAPGEAFDARPTERTEVEVLVRGDERRWAFRGWNGEMVEDFARLIQEAVMNDERRVTRKEAVERVESRLRRPGWITSSREQAEEIVEAIGAWEPEDKPPELPELPEGWGVEQWGNSRTLCRLTIPGPTGRGMYFYVDCEPEVLRAALARALAALRQDDGEVEKPTGPLAIGDTLWMRVFYAGQNTETRRGVFVRFPFAGKMTDFIADPEDIRLRADERVW
jgi:hypothetical protein